MHQASLDRSLSGDAWHSETRAERLLEAWLQVPSGAGLVSKRVGSLLIARWKDGVHAKRDLWLEPSGHQIYICTRPVDGGQAPASPVVQRVGCWAVLVPNSLWGTCRPGQRVVQLPSESALVQIAMDLLDSVWRRSHELNASQEHSLQCQLVEMMRACCTPSGEVPESGRGRVTLQDVQAYVHRRLEDIELTPASIALGLGVSVRYLHKLMRCSGQTLCRYILNARLERSRSLLISQIVKPDTVTDIALWSGFSNMTHFSRVFRERYGVSPSQFRRTLTVSS